MSAQLKPLESLSQSFSDSLLEETMDCIGDMIEVGLDSSLDDGILKDIPFISTVVSVYHIGNSIRDRYNLKKTAFFIKKIKQGIQTEEDSKKYKKKFQENEKFRNKELEYILILIDRYVGYDKPQILAKLYLSYLNNTITWDELSIYAETIDRFLPGDTETLCAVFLQQRNNLKELSGSFARLISLGLLNEEIITHKTSGSTMTMFSKVIKQFQLTPFGKSLATILMDNLF